MANTGGRGGGRRQAETVPAVDRALRILAALAASPQRLTGLARHLALPKSTTLAILRTLQHHRAVAYDPVSSRYHIGAGLSAIAGSAHDRRDLQGAARPVLERLARSTHETVILHVPDGSGGAVVIDSVESRHQLRVAAPPGHRLPPFAGAVAKAILATLPDEETARLIPPSLPHFTPRSIPGRAVYLRSLRRARARGYATDDEEYLPGVRAVSAPITGSRGETVATLSVVGVRARFPAARAARVGRRVAEAAGEISRTLGARPAVGGTVHG